MLGMGSSASVAYTLRKNYCKYVFAFECKYDKGGVDPVPIIAQYEAAAEAKKAKSQANRYAKQPPSPGRSKGIPNMQDGMFRAPNMPNDFNHMNQPYNNLDMALDGGVMPPNTMAPPSTMPHHGMMGNQESIMVQDPFADDPNMGGPRTMNSQMPPYSGMNHRPMNNAGGMHPGGFNNFDGMQRMPTSQYEQPRPNMPPDSFPNRMGMPDGYNQFRGQNDAFGNDGHGPHPPPSNMTPRRMPPVSSKPDNFNQPPSLPPPPPQQYPGQRPPYSGQGGQFFQQHGMQGYNTPQKPPMPAYPSPKRFPDSFNSPQAQRRDWPMQQQQQRFPNQMGPNNPNMPPLPPYSAQRPMTQQRMSPHKDNKPQQFYQSPAKPQQKRELVFPPGSVEAAQPNMMKRRKLTCRDIEKVDPWRLVMCLKSGLLAESRWALDMLSVLLYDNTSAIHFNLQHFPGLLDVLLLHYRRALKEIFTDINTYEICMENDQKSSDNADENETSGQIVLFSGKDYTWNTRQNKPVKLDPKTKPCQITEGNAWDVFCGFKSSKKDFASGKLDSAKHLALNFERLDTVETYSKGFYGSKILDLKCGNSESKSSEALNEHIDETHEEHDVEKSDSGSTKSKESEDSGYTTDVKSEPPVLEVQDSKSKADGLTSSIPVLTKTMEQENGGSDVKDEKAIISNTDCDNETKCNETVQTSEANKQSQNSEAVDSSASKCNEKDEDNFNIRIRKRRFSDCIEVEPYNRDMPVLGQKTDYQEELVRRCLCLANIIRNFSFIPGSDSELARHRGLLMTIGELLNLHIDTENTTKYQRYHRDKLEEESEHEHHTDSDPVKDDESISCPHKEWWWECLDLIREHTFVTLANMAGHLDLIDCPEPVCFPIFDGLLYWITCPSAYAQDPLPTQPSHSVLSPQRLVLETLCKLCVHDSNVDLILATKPFSRIVKLFENLVRMLANHREQVLREFAIVLLSNLVQGDASAARALALQHPSISLLIDFLETAEHNAMQVANTQGVHVLRTNPEMMGTTLDMLRRAAYTLLYLSQVPENRPLFMHHQDRLLALVMSQILDQYVAQLLSDVLYECSLPAELD